MPPTWAGARPSETEILRLLASGRVGRLGALLRRSGRDDAVARLAATDARARALVIDPLEVQEVQQSTESREPPDSPLRFWASAMLAERLLLDLDMTGFVVARRASEALDRCRPPPLPLPPLALRHARARLARVESFSYLAAPGARESSSHRAMRDRAVSELLACRFVDEVHLTRGLAAGLAALGSAESTVEDYVRLVDARSDLGDDAESVWPRVLDAFVALVALEVGDLAAGLDALVRLEQVSRRHPRLEAVVAYGRAFIGLVTGEASPSAVAAMERALSMARRHDPRIAQVWHGQVAGTLADLGSSSAGRVARFEGELPARGPVHELVREIVHMRVAEPDGPAPRADAAFSRLERLERLGHRHWSGRLALRLAHDLVRSGDVASARRLHAWGLERVPLGWRATAWERWWARPVGDQSSAGPEPLLVGSPSIEPRGAAGRTTVGHASRLGLRVLTPAAEVLVDGTAVTISDVQTKLLLALAVSHPAPLNVEQVADLLWPDEPLPAVRHRLNNLVLRLRRALGDLGDAVVRAGDLLRLDAQRCEVDLWQFRRSLAGDGHERAAALASVRGNLCDAQFPYEERFVEERHRVCGEWQRHAREAVQAGSVGPDRLGTALAALGLTWSDLGGPAPAPGATGSLESGEIPASERATLSQLVIRSTDHRDKEAS